MATNGILMRYIRKNFCTEENAVYFTRTDMMKFARMYHKDKLSKIK